MEKKTKDTLTRQEMLELHADEMHAPLLIHLNKTGTHFSALLPYVPPVQPSKPAKCKLQSVGSQSNVSKRDGLVVDTRRSTRLITMKRLLQQLGL